MCARGQALHREAFTFLILFLSYNEVHTTIISVIEVKTLRHRKGKQLDQGHTAGTSQCQDSNPGVTLSHDATRPLFSLAPLEIGAPH